MDLIIAKLFENAVFPTRKYPTDAGLDFYSYSPEEYVVIQPFSFKIVHTGITVEIPKGFVAQIWPKSRSDFLIGGGIIDSNYQGEILVKIYNGDALELIIKHGDPIAQMVLVPVITPKPLEIPFKDAHKKRTDRGATGGIVEQTVSGFSQLAFIDFSKKE